MRRLARQVRGPSVLFRILLHVHEIVDNLIGSDTANPVVREIKTQMAKEFGQEVLFRYPSDGSGLQILKKTDQGVAELTNGEKDAFMRRLWEVALTRVNETML